MVKRLYFSVLFICCTISAVAQFNIGYSISVTGNVATDGDFAPYYISSGNHGFPTQSKSGYLRAAATHDIDLSKRFSYGFGVDLVGGASNGTMYEKYDVATESWGVDKQKPANFWIQQLYGEIKFRGVFLSVGMKEHGSKLLNNRLSSGDLTFSGNIRPVPEVRAGFINYQNIPFTNGWVQIEGVYSLGKTMDTDWLENHYNYYNRCITTGFLYNYKRCSFRTKPTERFYVIASIQAAMQLGGTSRLYAKGHKVKEWKEKVGWKEIGQTLIPGEGSSSGNKEYYAGNSTGSLDFAAAYRLKNNDEIRAYFQVPYEDGSGIAFQNGMDGLFGIEYKAAKKGWVNGAVIEWLEFMNQSGPLHWAPNDHDDKSGHFPDQATGADDYYNNFQYPGYQYLGMSIGTPFLKSPIYNKDGSISFKDNRVRGFHVGMSGNILPELEYRVLASWRTSLGSPYIPRLERVNCTSAMIEAIYDIKAVKGLQAKCQLAFDCGKLYGNNFGALVSLTYNGNLKFGK